MCLILFSKGYFFLHTCHYVVYLGFSNRESESLTTFVGMKIKIFIRPISKVYIIFVLSIFVFLSSCHTVMSIANKSIVFSADAPKPIGPYSQAVIASNLVFVSGQIAIDPKTNALVTESIEIETNQVMQNLKAVLLASGTDFSKVVKCTIFVKNLNDFQKINAVYATYFEHEPPARETVEVSRLPKEANVEISCIAIK